MILLIMERSLSSQQAVISWRKLSTPSLIHTLMITNFLRQISMAFDLIVPVTATANFTAMC